MKPNAQIRVARALWRRHYGHPDLFERCLARRGGDTSESDTMFQKVMEDAQVAIKAMESDGQSENGK